MRFRVDEVLRTKAEDGASANDKVLTYQDFCGLVKASASKGVAKKVKRGGRGGGGETS